MTLGSGLQTSMKLGRSPPIQCLPVLVSVFVINSPYKQNNILHIMITHLFRLRSEFLSNSHDFLSKSYDMKFKSKAQRVIIKETDMFTLLGTELGISGFMIERSSKSNAFIVVGNIALSPRRITITRRSIPTGIPVIRNHFILNDDVSFWCFDVVSILLTEMNLLNNELLVFPCYLFINFY